MGKQSKWAGRRALITTLIYLIIAILAVGLIAQTFQYANIFNLTGIRFVIPAVVSSVFIVFILIAITLYFKKKRELLSEKGHGLFYWWLYRVIQTNEPEKKESEIEQSLEYIRSFLPLLGLTLAFSVMFGLLTLINSYIGTSVNYLQAERLAEQNNLLRYQSQYLAASSRNNISRVLQAKESTPREITAAFDKFLDIALISVKQVENGQEQYVYPNLMELKNQLDFYVAGQEPKKKSSDISLYGKQANSFVQLLHNLGVKHDGLSLWDYNEDTVTEQKIEQKHYTKKYKVLDLRHLPSDYLRHQNLAAIKEKKILLPANPDISGASFQESDINMNLERGQANDLFFEFGRWIDSSISDSNLSISGGRGGVQFADNKIHCSNIEVDKNQMFSLSYNIYRGNFAKFINTDVTISNTNIFYSSILLLRSQLSAVNSVQKEHQLNISELAWGLSVISEGPFLSDITYQLMFNGEMHHSWISGAFNRVDLILHRAEQVDISELSIVNPEASYLHLDSPIQLKKYLLVNMNFEPFQGATIKVIDVIKKHPELFEKILPSDFKEMSQCERIASLNYGKRGTVLLELSKLSSKEIERLESALSDFKIETIEQPSLILMDYTSSISLEKVRSNHFTQQQLLNSLPFYQKKYPQRAKVLEQGIRAMVVE